MRPVLQRRVDQAAAALSIEIAADLGKVETDVRAVEQILFNLIDNACKYGLLEGQQGHVTLDVRKGRRGIIFEVRDEGRGIDGAEKKRLFRAFHKSAHDAAHDKPGVGLGLALCRRLARALGGDLELGSSREGGASFVLNLP
jgi:signal transduction histidine kinase